MKNKNTAIILSIVAVIVVTYQIFFRPPDKPAPRLPASPPASAPTAMSPVRPGNNQNTGTIPSNHSGSAVPGSADDDAPIIDFNSPILLDRATRTPVEPWPKEELIPEYGPPIFIAPANDTERKEKITREIEFRLNSIVIDGERRVSVINNRVVFPGDFLDGAEVALIEKDRVVLSYRGKIIELTSETRVQRVTVTGGNSEK